METTVQVWAYPAHVAEDSPGDWLVTFDDLPEALTGGRTREEALHNAADALEEAVLAYLARGRPIPAPRAAAEGEELIVLDVVTAARAALAEVMRTNGISNAALARGVGRSEGAVRRLVDGTTGVKIDTVLQALAATAAFSPSSFPRPALAFVE
jgi:antitoxin HicB